MFSRLARVYLRPPPLRREDVRLRSRLRASGGAPVTVVEQTRVAGLDATVLSATDPGALATWLRGHGYATRPDLDAWLAPYVAQGFHVTAFRYDRARQTALTSRAVRMTFPSERAFYPYSEPADGEAAPGRTLRLIAPFRVAAHEGTRPWRARVGYAGRPGGLDALLGGVLPAGTRTGEWMTTFDDVPRGAAGPICSSRGTGASARSAPPSTPSCSARAADQIATSPKQTSSGGAPVPTSIRPSIPTPSISTR